MCRAAGDLLADFIKGIHPQAPLAAMSIPNELLFRV